ALSVPLIKILTTESFYSAWKFVPMLSLAMVFSAFANFMGSVYVVEKRSKNSFLTTMVGAGVNILLNFILIPKIGSQGAAIATFVSYLAVFIIRTFDAKKYIPFKTHFVTVSINCLIVLLQIGYMLFGLPFNYPVQAVCFIALFVINFRFFKVFFEKILSFVKRRIC
ncbi:MAG: polysaccharide biosynthesis C-terminal domain-containing protein, partial [Clostridia bacterium]|nr:polysaccharide biosynthesis C-terminal domain-containing protein [Clostridia bacterium]